MQSDNKQVTIIPRELKILNYKNFKLLAMRQLILEKFDEIFDENISSVTNETLKTPATPSANSNSAFSKEELIELMFRYIPDLNKKKRKHMSKCIRREVWNRYIGEEHGTHVCFCCDVSIMSQFVFEVGHVVSVHDNRNLSFDNLRPICLLCNRSMGTPNMPEFIKAQNLSG